MRPKLIGMLMAACGIALCAGAPTPAHATQLNVVANECQPLLEFQDGYGRSEKGVFLDPALPGSREVVCAVPRLPDPGGAAFYIDGDNFVAGAYTECLLYSWDEHGSLIAQQFFHTAAAKYDVFVTFLPEQLAPLGLLTLHCFLPPAGQGMLRGVTSLPVPPILLAPTDLATNINASLVECQGASGPQNDLVHEWAGVATRGGKPSRVVNCAVPRFSTSQAPGTFNVSAFIVRADASIDCTLYSYEFTGAFLGSVSFTLSSTARGQIAQQVSLPAAQLSLSAYTSMSCILPASGGAVLTSVVAL